MKLNNINTSHCQVETVKYKDREYRVQTDRNGFRFIKVSENGKRKIIPLKTLEPNDIVFDYVFNGTFQKTKNNHLEMCVLLRCSSNPEQTFNKQKEKLLIQENWQQFKEITSKLNKNFKSSCLIKIIALIFS